MPIDSAGQVKNYWNFKNFPNVILGDQLKNFHQTTPINNFLTVQPILTKSIPIDSAQQAQGHENIKKGKNFILGEQLGSLKKIYP
jgi:hypothetical protein